MGSLNNLLLTHDLRHKRMVEKQFLVLRFLRQHLWSTQNILQQVLMLESRQASHKTLSKMEAALLIKRSNFSVLGKSLTLWGITPHGQAMAFLPAIESPFMAYFEPSRIAVQNIRHELDLQQLRIDAEHKGWTNWTDGARIGEIPKDGKRPDAVAIDPDGRTVAIECERTIKTHKRYEQILVTYLRSIKSGKVDLVILVCPSKLISERLRIILTGIKTVKIAGQKIAIDPIKHHVKLKFISYEEWPYK